MRRIRLKRGWQLLRKRILKLRSRRARRKFVTIALILGVIVGAIVIVEKRTKPNNIPMTAYGPLLGVIAKGESGGNYDAYYGNAANTDIHFSEMTVGQVLEWQTRYVAQGSPSSAVGKYQIIRPTLQRLVQQLAIARTTRFDAALQDKLAVALLERRGSVEFVAGQITQQQFAANVAKEWASLPKAIGENPEQSYYAGDGLNHARIGVDEVYKAITLLQANS